MSEKNSAAKTLEHLVQHSLGVREWSTERAAREAATLGIKGLKARNIGEYATGGRTRPPKRAIIEKFAKLFGESPASWVEQFPQFGLDPLLLDRDAIIQDQEKLTLGDEVSLITSRSFLEAHDKDVAALVQRKLTDGVIYRYYFPAADYLTYGGAAAGSFQRFRQRYVAHHRFKRPPMVFGYTVDPTQFRFLSDLHTIVLYRSRAPVVAHAPERKDFYIKRAYVYIEAVRGEAGQAEQKWYLLPDDMAKQIASNLDDARLPIPDVNLPILSLNPFLPRVRADYLKWFQSADSPARYSVLRPVLGHSGDRCLRMLLAEIAQVGRDADSVRYLDIGCGDGELTYEIAKYLSDQCKVTVVGLDPSKSQLDSAKACFANADHTDFSTHVGAFETFSDRGMFHLITAIHSFYAIDEAYVRRLFELLAPGGIACIWMARREYNVVTALCDALDDALRPGQKRNTADDVYRYAAGAGLHVEMKHSAGALPRLVDANGEPTADGQNLIDFCALQTVTKGTKAWNAAVKALAGPKRNDGGDHPLTDGLVVIQRLP